MQIIEDELLKWRFKRGSREALARIYEKYVNALLSLAMGLLNDPHEAQDVVQDVFVSLAKGVDGFKVQGSLKAYLAQSVVNRVRDRIRRKHSQQRRVDAVTASIRDAGKLDPALVYNERCERLSAALAQLPDEQREALTLRLQAGMKFKEIARFQDVPLKTALSRYRCGLTKMRSLLNGKVPTCDR